MYVCNYVYLNGNSSQFADERNNTQPTTFIKYQNFPLNKYMNTKYKIQIAWQQILHHQGNIYSNDISNGTEKMEFELKPNV